MKTLKAFWHWVDNEKPSAELYAEKAGDNLSDLAHAALLEAERFVGARAGVGSLNLLDRVTDEEHLALRPAWRDLSLALCAALEHMHDQVEDDYLGKRYPARPDVQTQAVIPSCPACRNAPCSGSHVSCNPDRYLRENGLVASAGSGLALLGTDELANEALFAGEWVTSVNLSADAIERSKRLTEQQLAASPGGIRSLADWLPPLPPPRAADARLTGPRLSTQEINASTYATICEECGGAYFHVRGCSRHTNGCAPCRIAAGDGLKPLRPDTLTPPPPWHGGKTGSTWDPQRRQLEVFTVIDRACVDRLRGLSPLSIIVRGHAKDYAPGVLPYLREVILPMMIDGGSISAHEDPQILAEFGFV